MRTQQPPATTAAPGGQPGTPPKKRKWSAAAKKKASEARLARHAGGGGLTVTSGTTTGGTAKAADEQIERMRATARDTQNWALPQIRSALKVIRLEAAFFDGLERQRLAQQQENAPERAMGAGQHST